MWSFFCVKWFTFVSSGNNCWGNPLMGKILACYLLECSLKNKLGFINKKILLSLWVTGKQMISSASKEVVFWIEKMGQWNVQCPLIEDQSHVRTQIETFRLLSVFSTSCLPGLWETTQVSRFDMDTLEAKMEEKYLGSYMYRWMLSRKKYSVDPFMAGIGAPA